MLVTGILPIYLKEIRASYFLTVAVCFILSTACDIDTVLIWPLSGFLYRVVSSKSLRNPRSILHETHFKDPQKKRARS
jgi:hypothetical protein